jgi:hypothetical protein
MEECPYAIGGMMGVEGKVAIGKKWFNNETYQSVLAVAWEIEITIGLENDPKTESDGTTQRMRRSLKTNIHHY